MQNNIAESPQDYLPYLYLSRLYITLGKNDTKSPYNDLALKADNEALKISPTFVRTYYEVGQAYLNKGDLENSFIWFEKAQKLQPDVALTYWYMGSVRYQIALQKKDIAGIKEAAGYYKIALAKGYKISESDGQKLVNIFVQLDDMDGVIAMLQQLTVNIPTDAQYWSSLAAAYAKVGRTQEALATARKLIELFPNDVAIKADAEQFIRSLGETP